MKRYKKNLLAAAAFLFCSLSLSAQSADHNYVKQETMLNASKSQKITSVQYYDGYSRPVLRAEDGTAGGGKYTFALTTYDNVGRVSESWLPAVGTTSSNFLTTSEVKSLSSSTYGDSYAYTCNHYDALGRTTSVDGIGSAWRSAGKKVTTAYGTNTWNEVRKYTAMAGSTTLSYSTCYSSGTLSVETVTDEDGKTHSVYKDATGKIVLERSASNHDTYYVYDDMDRLRFVLPPCASDALASTGSWSMDSNDVLRDYAYYYEYDGRGRCIKKKLPGAEHVLYEYDIRDRMTFSQDGVQRTGGKWTFYVYDNLNRLVQQGENTSKAVSASGVYLQNYYDNYDFVGDVGFTDNRFVDDTSGYAKGSLTGTVMNVFGSGEKIYTAYYYDAKGRVIKTIENNLMGGYNTTETTYTFTGQPATVTITHTASGKLTQTEVYTYSYDHSDRISSVSHKLNNGSTVTLASYTYDNVGRIATKKLHGSSSNQLTYAYNVRSWLTGISSGKFSQNLTYNNGSTGFNGNITAMNWNANGTSHSYSFTYDNMNRMLNATHGTGAYTEKVTGYDKNSNILALQRYGNGLIDNLSYTYNGNQLTKVEDATGNANGFVNGASTSNEYTYDHNGNLTKDLNKNISNIQYNSLNLPSVVTFSNGSTITYLYAADGRKLRTVHVINGFSFTTDYSGNVIYENGSQKLLLTEEGYINLANGNAYYYYLKDHQGNNRLVVSSSGTVAETNHYYPFGGTFATSSSSVQPYKYNGKELDTKASLNWYDYGARHYDSALGRWFVVDPLAEKMYGWSPYGYCFNNPVGSIDFEGKLVIFINGFHNGFQGGKKIYWNTKHGQFDDAVMNHFSDYNSLYYDGSIGGITGIPANIVMKNRFDAGYIVGSKEAGDIIAKLTRDNNGNIIETIKIVTHSMGGAYGKGLVSALMEYIHQHPKLTNGISIAEYDFAPFQSAFQKAVNGVDTYQYSHTFDRVAGNEPIEGAEMMDTKNANNAKHSINDFYEYIKNLPQGRYKIENGEVVKNE